MQNILNEAADDSAESWKQIAPLLDGALEQLGQKDHDAVVLRFFEGRNFKEVGTALGASEDAAKMRVNRALEKLRKFFTKRGVTLSAVAIAGAVSANSVQAAPIGLTISAVAAAKGSAVAVSTLTLVKGALKIMAWTKAKPAIVVGVGMLLAAGTATMVVKELNPSGVDDKWFEIGNFTKAPPNLLAIRPTKFPSDHFSGTVFDPTGRELGNSILLKDFIARAYGESIAERGYSTVRMSYSEPWPEDKFDYLITMPGDVKQQLQAAIKKQLGLQARRETREQNVFLLRHQTPNAPGLTVTGGASPDESFNTPGKLCGTNQPISVLAGRLENMFDVPVLDETGLKGNFDFVLDYPLIARKASPARRESAQKTVRTSLLSQLGLELVPSRQSIEMLVVERVK